MQRVLVTGAAGFVGGWITETFQLAGIPVRAGIRRWNSAVRLARRPVDIAACDVLAPEQLRAALVNCDTVVHCAVGNDQVTVAGTRNVLAAAEAQRVRRIVYLSSVAVYGKATGVIDETAPRRSRGNPYAKRKIAAEHVCDEFIARGVPVVVLRPSIIYGPFSQAWTVSFAQRLCSGKWGTFGPAGMGKCNLVYVTDVVQAVHRALVSDQAVGEAFNINGDEIITWNDYFVRFNEALGRPPLGALKARPIAWKARLLAPVRGAGRVALARFNRSLMKLHTKHALAAKYMKVTEASLKLTPTSEQLKLYGVDVEYPIDKATQQLGYEPRVPMTAGLALCVDWLAHQGLIPDSPWPNEVPPS